jgi:aryl-alcohol dehydrogenase-like predicted oxidoreductase
MMASTPSLGCFERHLSHRRRSARAPPRLRNHAPGGRRRVGRALPIPPNARRVLRRAVELGVTLIDTADAYGPEIAERLIGEALAPYPPGVVIATKGGITRQGPAKTEYVGRAGYLIQCVEMSLRRLKLERIDLYQLHPHRPAHPARRVLGRAPRMQEQGKIRHIGLERGHAPPKSKRREKIVPIVTVQNRYSLADRRHEETLNYCQRQGIGFLPWYPNAGGKLLKPDHPSAQALAGSPHRHGPRRRSSRWRGSCSARRSCCPFPAPPKSRTSKKTSPPPN